MRIAVLYDIHGNLPALDAVLAEAQQAGVERILVGGDVVPGPLPRETLARLLALPLPVDFIQGNGDRAVLEAMQGLDTGALPASAREAVRWVARQLGPREMQAIASWPKTLRLALPEAGEVLFCHATPRSDTEIFTRLTPEPRVQPAFAGLGVATVVCGHTHMQFDRAVGGVRIVNAGSVGMPFGPPGACWLLLGPQFEHRRTAYDFAAAAACVRATAYPQAEDFAEHAILRPRSEEEMLATFAKVAI